MKGPAKAKHREYRSKPPRQSPADRGDDREHPPEHEKHADGENDFLCGVHADMNDQPLQREISEDVAMEMCERESWQLSSLDLWSEPGVVNVTWKISPTHMRQP